MELNRDMQWKKRDSGVGGLLNKINNAVKASEHFKLFLSSLINSDNAASSNCNGKLVPDHRAKQVSASSSKSGGRGDVSQRGHSSKSSTIFTVTPDHDGHQWRKYGEKKIVDNKFPRSYYRCTYQLEQNCNATKQVQQWTDDDSPMYKVTYFQEHTCTNIYLLDAYSTDKYQQILDFSAKETPTITSLEKQLPSSSDDHRVGVSSLTNSEQTTDQGSIEFESMETDLSLYDTYDLEELLSSDVNFD